MTAVNPNSLIQRTFAAIKDDPGVSCEHISEQLGVSGTQIKHAIAYLRRTGRIVNRGKHARGASWYPRG